MLTLRSSNNYQHAEAFYKLTDNYDFIFDSNIQYLTDNSVVYDREHSLNTIYRKPVYEAVKPLLFNNIKVEKETFYIDPTNLNKQSLVTRLTGKFESLDLDTLSIIHVYSPDVNSVKTLLDTTEFLTDVNDNIKSLYNKCFEQTLLRNEVPQQELENRKLYVKISKAKHMIILISNYSDNQQASEIFLTIGLVPVIFQDLKDRFEEKEIEYFKALVSRSQVKRISNVKVSEAFNNLSTISKYKTFIENILFEDTIKNILSERLRSAQRIVTNTSERISDAMRDYERLLNEYYNANIILNNLKESEDAVRDEIRTVLRSEYVHEYTLPGNSIVLVLKAPISFYDIEEYECAIKNMNPDSFAYKFLKDIFKDNKYELYVTAAFTLNFSPNSNFNRPGNVPINILNETNALFNPHIYFFNCLGDYLPQLTKAHAEKDLLMFYNIALASLRSINFKDGTVINRWKEYLNNLVNGYVEYSDLILNLKCLKDSDGNFHSINEVYLNTDNTEIEEIEVQDI